MRVVSILYLAVILMLAICMGCKSQKTSDTHSDSGVASSEIVGKWRWSNEAGTGGQDIEFIEDNTCKIENYMNKGTVGQIINCKWNVLEDGRIEVLINSYGVEIPFIEAELEGDSFYTTLADGKEYEYLRIE